MTPDQMKITRLVLDKVMVERVYQHTKWGEQNHDYGTWGLILGEEVGEAMQAALEAKFNGKPIAHVRKELLQVAAVAVQWIEAIDRREERP